MSTNTILPLEILDRIFSFLDNEKPTRSTLKACSVIRDPVLRAAIDRYMYTHIYLCKWKLCAGQIDADEIHRYLSSNPHVANYVRTLHITVMHRFKDSYQEWYSHATPILQMLPSSLERITLSSLVHIDATGSTSRLVRFAWMDFSAAFRTAFLNCVWSPNIIEVSMQRIGEFPLSIFNTCTRLKTLSLLNCTPSTLDAQFPPQINSLVLSEIEDLETVVSWATTRHDLRSLKFEWRNKADRSDGYCLIRLLDSYADNLIELELDFRPLTPSNFNELDGRMEMDPPLRISHIQKLTQLTVSVYLDCNPVKSLLPGVITLVAASSPLLKHLILRATIRPGSFKITGVHDFFRPLVSLADHPSLEHVEIQITLALWQIDWRRVVAKIVHLLKRMPELKMLWNKGVLSVRGFGPEGS